MRSENSGNGRRTTSPDSEAHDHFSRGNGHTRRSAVPKFIDEANARTDPGNRSYREFRDLRFQTFATGSVPKRLRKNLS